MEQLRYVARATGADSSMLVEEAAQALAMFARDPQALLVACKQLLSRQPVVGGLWWLCSRMLIAPDALTEARAVVSDVRSDATADTLAAAVNDKRWQADRSLQVVVAGWPDTIVNALSSSDGQVPGRVLVIEVEGVGHGAVRRLERSGVDAEVVAAERIAGAVADSDLVLVEAAAVGQSGAVVDVAGVALAAAANVQDVPTWLVSPPSRVMPASLWPDIEAGRRRWGGPKWMAPTELLASSLIDAVVCADGRHTDLEELRSGLNGGWAAAPELIGLIQ